MMNDIVKTVCAVRWLIYRCRLHGRREAIGRACVAILVGICLGTPGPAMANPVGLNSPTPGVTFSGVGTPNVTITSSAVRSIVNAQGFNIEATEATNVIQAANAAMLVRIGSLNPTSINGQLNAMGTLILLNPNGVLFGPGAQVNVNGLIASSLNMTDANFLTGRYSFEGAATAGMVRNEGQITAGPLGVYLFAPNVANNGVITSPGGHIALAAGTTAYLSDRGDGRGFLVEVTAPAGEAVNLQSLVADGGRVSMIGRLVAQSGLVQANSVQKQNGTIKLVASEQATLGATGRTVADGGHISVSGRVIEQQGLVQSIGTPAQSGRVELVAAERVNLRAGSQTVVKGGETDISDGGTIAVMATHATDGTVTIEPGAGLDLSGGAQGGHGGELWLGGISAPSTVPYLGTALPGFEAGHLHMIPRTRTVTAADLSAGPSRSSLNFYALDDLTVNAPSFNLSSRTITPALDGAARAGTLRFWAGNNLLFSNTTIQNGQTNGTGALNGWSSIGTANNDIVFTTTTLSTSGGGSIALNAGRDIKLLPDGGGGFTTLRTFTGGDMTIDAGRDLIAPFVRQANGQYAGIRLQGIGNLSITAGRDFLGGMVAAAPGGPGFLLSEGTAHVTVGGNLGSVYVPGSPNTTGPANGYATFMLGGGAFDTGTRQVVPGSQGIAKINVTAGGNIHLGTVQDTGAAEGFGRGEFEAVTVHPHNALTLTSQTGDIYVNPLDINLTQTSTHVLPPTFKAAAPNGNIFIQSDLDFWPSARGTLEFEAGKNVQGVVDSAGFVTTQVSLCNGCIGNVETGSASQPVPVNFSAGGDIRDLKLDMHSPVVTKVFTMVAGQDIRNVFGRIPAPNLGNDSLGNPIPSVAITAGRDIDFSGGVVRDPTGSGFFFGGTGLARVAAGRDLNLADSQGLTHRFNTVESTIDADKGGLLEIAIGRDLSMTESRIITNNGASLFVHGLAAGIPVVGTTATATSATLGAMTVNGQNVLAVEGDPVVGPDGSTPILVNQTNRSLIGNSVYVVGGRAVLDIAGLPVVVGAQDTVVGRTVLVVDGAATLGLNGKPIVVEPDSSSVVLSGDLVHGTVVLDRPLVQLADGTVLLVTNGKTVFSTPAEAGSVDGRPTVNDGIVTLLVEGKRVEFVEPVGGSVNVGTNRNSVDDQTGIVTMRGGSIDLKAAGNIDVNLSRIATLGGGDITLTSTAGDINAGTGARTDVTQFPIEEPGPDGTTIRTFFRVPGSGIFTFHPRDGDLPNVPPFNPISPFEAQVFLHQFFGHDVSKLEPLVPAAHEVWLNQYKTSVEELFAGFQLGDIRLTAAHDVIVPPAGIRGRNITINAGRNLDLQGGMIRGISDVNIGGQLVGSLTSFVGVFAVNLGGVSGGAPGSTLGLGAISGGVGTVTTSSAVTTATSTTSLVGSKASEDVVSGQPVNEPKAVSDRSRRKGGQPVPSASLRIKDKVKIRVETKPEQAM